MSLAAGAGEGAHASDEVAAVLSPDIAAEEMGEAVSGEESWFPEKGQRGLHRFRARG